MTRDRNPTYLDEVLALSLGDQRLEFRCRECIYQTRFGDDEEEYLGARQDR